jgi:small subunit ribosomal protein S1
VGEKVKGKVERHEKFGVFVFLAPGKTGLIPNEETGLPRGADLRKAFPVASEVEVLVLDIDPSGRRIRLSRRAVEDAEERADARDFATRQEGQATGSFGSLADKLRAALGGSDRS